MSKSRQIGFSLIIAGEGVHAAATRRGYRANYVSINQDEAKDKIEYAKTLYHSIPENLNDTAYKPLIWHDAEDTFGFHGPPDTSLLISKPASSAVRGGKKDIYFDEAAHIREFGKLYQAALPATIRGEGRMTVISTPMDESGLFYDLVTDVDNYPEYTRHVVPWWESGIMVKDHAVEEAMALAPTLGTPDRVAQFGSPKLISVYKSFGADIQGFQTEFECAFVDELGAFFPWELIVDAVEDGMEFFGREIPSNWQPEGTLSLGVDLAKERDESVFTLVETIEDEDGEPHRYIRWIKTTQAPYKEQWEFLNNVLRSVPISRVSVDATGVGNMLVEQLRGNANIESVVFNNAKKEGWATNFKSALQTRRIHIPRHQDLMKQIHGIKRTKTEGGLYKFSGKKDDYFWSLMLACYGEGRLPVRFRIL